MLRGITPGGQYAALKGIQQQHVCVLKSLMFICEFTRVVIRVKPKPLTHCYCGVSERPAVRRGTAHPVCPGYFRVCNERGCARRGLRDGPQAWKDDTRGLMFSEAFIAEASRVRGVRKAVVNGAVEFTVTPSNHMFKHLLWRVRLLSP